MTNFRFPCAKAFTAASLLTYVALCRAVVRPNASTIAPPSAGQWRGTYGMLDGRHDARLILERLPTTIPLALMSMTIAILIAILLQVVATWIFYDRHWDTMTNRLAYAVGGEIGMVIEQLERDGSMANRTETLAMAARLGSAMARA